MTAAARPLVVLTPVRDEAWILERFLAVTSRLADLILILDQGSSDGSREIARSYPNVHLLENPSQDYDEASRQLLLLQAARERVPGEKVLLALDADEIVAADAPTAPGWRAMLGAPAGTVLCFEKPDLWKGVEWCLRYSRPWPLGYVDDGAPHRPRRVHSIRLPEPEGAPRLHLEDVKILHYALTRLDCQAAKARFYSIQENLHGTSPLHRRRASYSPDRDWGALGRPGPVPEGWLVGWEELGIDLRTIRREVYYWQDFEVLRIFARHGVRRFWLENIWSFDWEACRRHSLAVGMAGMPERSIESPPSIARLAGRLLDILYGAWSFQRRLRGSRNHSP